MWSLVWLRLFVTVTWENSRRQPIWVELDLQVMDVQLQNFVAAKNMTHPSRNRDGQCPKEAMPAELEDSGRKQSGEGVWGMAGGGGGPSLQRPGGQSGTAPAPLYCSHGAHYFMSPAVSAREAVLRGL